MTITPTRRAAVHADDPATRTSDFVRRKSHASEPLPILLRLPDLNPSATADANQVPAATETTVQDEPTVADIPADRGTYASGEDVASEQPVNPEHKAMPGSRSRRQRVQESWYDWRKQGLQVLGGLALIALLVVAAVAIQGKRGDEDEAEAKDANIELPLPADELAEESGLDSLEALGSGTRLADESAVDHELHQPLDSGEPFPEPEGTETGAFDPGTAPWIADEGPSQPTFAETTPSEYPETDPANFRRWTETDPRANNQFAPARDRGPYQALDQRPPNGQDRREAIQRPPFQDRSRR